MYLVHIYAYPYKYTYIQVLMAQNSCISQPQGGVSIASREHRRQRCMTRSQRGQKQLKLEEEDHVSQRTPGS